MNSVEELIREKLTAVLEVEKRRIASTLVVDEAVNPSNVADKKAKKQTQIQAIRQRISAMQGKASTAKDPKVMQDKLTILKQKLSLMQQELTDIK